MQLELADSGSEESVPLRCRVCVSKQFASRRRDEKFSLQVSLDPLATCSLLLRLVLLYLLQGSSRKWTHRALFSSAVRRRRHRTSLPPSVQLQLASAQCQQRAGLCVCDVVLVLNLSSSALDDSKAGAGRDGFHCVVGFNIMIGYPAQRRPTRGHSS